MKICPICGKQLVDQAVRCPKCKTQLSVQQQENIEGFAPQSTTMLQRKKKKWLPIVIALISVFIVLLIIVSIGSNNEQPANEVLPNTSSQSSDKNNSSKLEENKVSSQNNKKDDPKTIKISAADLLAAYSENGVKADEDYKGKLLEITGIVKNVDRDILDDIYVTLDGGEEYNILSVQCYFSDKETSKIAQLKKDTKITIIGTCGGSSFNVIMKKCKIK